MESHHENTSCVRILNKEIRMESEVIAAQIKQIQMQENSIYGGLGVQD